MSLSAWDHRYLNHTRWFTTYYAPVRRRFNQFFRKSTDFFTGSFSNPKPTLTPVESEKDLQPFLLTVRGCTAAR